MAHRNIPIFIPHLGCPNQCVFCNQHSISGTPVFRREDAAKELETALSTCDVGGDTEIAFFGGSFTGIDRELMIWLLELAQSYVQKGLVRAIRLSTRPDYITEEILDILSRYSVRVIELGLQSMNAEVLCACTRGHTRAQAEDAMRAVVEAGFSLVGQMMIGLPAATLDGELETAERICALGASAVRIYPTVVFYNTPLYERLRRGEYQALTLQEAVTRSAEVLAVFEAHGVPCIRLGLCATEELASPVHVAAGPNHPALGEMVRSEVYYKKLLTALKERALLGKDVILYVPRGEESLAVGHGRRNLVRLLRETDTRIVKTVGEANRSGPEPCLAGDRATSRRNKRPCI